MALIQCKECNKEISSQAKACPHCGAPVERKSGGCGCLSIIGVVAVIVVIIAILGSGDGSSNSPTEKKKTVAVSVTANQFVLGLRNDGSTDWTEAVVYINGTPPFTYKATVVAPKVGESITIPLSDFVKDDGERFNPIDKAVTTVWVGGSSYDYESYRFNH